MMPQFKDRMYAHGQERQYLIRKQDGTTEIVDIEKLGIAEEGSRVDAAALNQFVDHINDPNLHVPRTEFTVLENEVKAIKNSLANDMRDNQFAFDFASINGLDVEAGWWDQANARLGIK
ncbi:hypothetical protein [Brevibacillus reuszeri]|uniref:hypothetical protein n=1 Tax=Brevibacillus reuszeri TaxID=54915 RepID=UPI0028A25200|nr:hypothetical protein [Brevibacillus reuszeri]